MGQIFEAMLQFFGGAARVLTWFISAVVIPLTVWLTVQRKDVLNLKQNVEANYAQQLRTENEIEIRRSENEKRFDDVMTALGRIEGELKRIK